MPYDIRAVDGIRVLLSDRHDIVERKMMGGLVFIIETLPAKPAKRCPAGAKR